MIKVGIIGFGRMGRFYLKEMLKSPKWEVVYICDVYEGSRELARKLAPNAKVISDEDIIFNDPEIQVVTLTALADSRLQHVTKAIAHGKHIISEKPVADTTENEWKAVEAVDETDRRGSG